MSDEDVGELAFVGAACTTGGLAGGNALGQEGLGRLVHPGLGDMDDVQDAVDFAVAG